MHGRRFLNCDRIFPVVMLLALLAVCGCTSLQVVNIENDVIKSELTEGDKVVVTTHDGAVQTFRITDIGVDVLQGDGITIPYSEMAKLQVARFDTKKTVWLTVSIIAIAAAAGSGGSSGGGY